MKGPEVVNIFEQIKDPGPQPEWPGDEPITDKPMDEARRVWHTRTREYGEWYKKNRRYQLALQAILIEKIPSADRTPVEEAVLLTAATVLENDVMAEGGLLAMLGLA